MLEVTGPIAPVVTPFTDDGGGISEIRLSRQIRRLLSYGVNSIAVATETGEFGCLSFSERKHLVELILRDGHGGVNIFPNVTSLSTAASLDLAQHAGRHGARAVIVAPPYFGNFTDSELEGHFKAILRYAPLPVIAVDPLGRLSAHALERLGEDPRFLFAKGAKGSDRFEVNGLKASPRFSLTTDDRPELDHLIDLHGGAKVVKAVLEEEELEMGPTRPPMQGLSHVDAREAVHAYRPPAPPEEPQSEE